jgi:hypothetical protein
MQIFLGVPTGPLDKTPLFAQEKTTSFTTMGSRGSRVFSEEDPMRALG